MSIFLEFQEFKKIPRLSRDIVITEKIDGTSGVVCVGKILKIKDIANVSNDYYNIVLKIIDNKLGFEVKDTGCGSLTGDTIITSQFKVDNQVLITLFGEDLPKIIELLEKSVSIIYAGSRNRWLWSSSQAEVCNDNSGFAKWVKDNKKEILKLGVGFHYGEWWGNGIQRGYGLAKDDKRFSLFNTGRWVIKDDGLPIEDIRELYKNSNLEYCPDCCNVVPVLYRGEFNTNMINIVLELLKSTGSHAVPGYMKPEGIVIYHSASGLMFKKTCENDDKRKTEA
jgi:hypothetical protein